ncbi:MAG: hypothetical protein WAV41_02355 [Microgenomates group bacterium]
MSNPPETLTIPTPRGKIAVDRSEYLDAGKDPDLLRAATQAARERENRIFYVTTVLLNIPRQLYHGKAIEKEVE